jgi:hypothetical protein
MESFISGIASGADPGNSGKRPLRAFYGYPDEGACERPSSLTD